jgi:sugar/nucleoside kinase (ribokinase family)
MLCHVIVVIGDVCVDVLARPTAAVRPGTDTEARVRVRGGGAGANTAAWLAHLGVPVTLVARIGDDAAGRAQLDELRGYGVVCAFTVDPVAPTGSVVVLVGPDGERTMLTDRGANGRLRAADLVSGDVCWDGHRHSRGHLHLSGYTLLHEGSRAAGLEALRAARAAGMTISVDPASEAPLAAVGVHRFRDWVEGVDLLLPNLPETLLLSGRGDPHAAAAVLARHHGAVAITLGAGGALWASGDAVEHVPALPVVAVDTTGAGDAFTAGLLAAWLSGVDGLEATRHGVRAAADAITRLGARPRA